jgi:hypothetical protein
MRKSVLAGDWWRVSLDLAAACGGRVIEKKTRE